MYRENDLVGIAKRENNTKRKYLVVNRIQAKHVPVEPSKTLPMFLELAKIIKEKYQDEKILLVGFAETATAIGAALATYMNAYYMQTTRENIPDVEYLFFTESHSHATEQKLVKDDIDIMLDRVERVVFVEDEITTGNTILNIINILNKQYSKQIKYAVASILNGMDTYSLEKYQENDIDIHYLLKTNHECYTQVAESYAGDGIYHKVSTDFITEYVNEIRIPGWKNARRCVKGAEYKSACEELWNNINKRMMIGEQEQVLVLGTEECMYPAIYVAEQLEKSGCHTLCHATTRSPIVVSGEQTYPLHTRYELRSFYDKERVTYIYDLQKYDLVLVITDAKSGEGEDTLLHALQQQGNKNITVIRWCEV